MNKKTEISDELIFKLLRTLPSFLRRIVHSHHGKENTGKLTRSQHKTLMLLFFEKVPHMSGLAEHLNLEKGSFTAVVDDLVEKGLVDKERDNLDHRKYNLTLTKNGRDLISRKIEKSKIQLEKKLACLKEEEYSRFIRAVNDLYEITMKL